MAEKKDYRSALPVKDRTADVIALAADLFVRTREASGKTSAGAARDALRAAREFYAVCDEPATEPKG